MRPFTFATCVRKALEYRVVEAEGILYSIQYSYDPSVLFFKRFGFQKGRELSLEAVVAYRKPCKPLLKRMSRCWWCRPRVPGIEGVYDLVLWLAFGSTSKLEGIIL